MQIRTVFMGSSEFSVEILRGLVKEFTVSGVVTQPDKPAGRGKKLTPPPVKILAEELEIPLIQPDRIRAPEAFEQLQSWNPELIVVAAYGQILRQNVLDLPKFGCINVHASYLPRWRGAAPIQAAILNGDGFTGVTIMKMDAGIDTGPELAKEKVQISPRDNAITLSQKLSRVGAELLVSTLNAYISGAISPAPQTEVGATYASIIKKEEGLLDFDLPAVLLERKIRAFIEWPGASMFFEDLTLKVREARVSHPSTMSSGQRSMIEGYPAVGTSDGDLVLMQVQPAGKKWMSGADFLRGVKNWVS